MSNPLEPVLEKVGRVLSDRYGIRVVCQGNRCCTDGKVIYLPALPDDVPPELMGAIRAFLDHEVGHIVGESSNTVGHEFAQNHGQDAFGVLNALEDLRVEEVMRKLYAGCGVNLHAGYEFSVRKIEENLQDLQTLRHVTTAIYSRGSRYGDIAFLDPVAYDICDELPHEIASSVTAKDTAEVARYAEKAWAVIKQHLGQQARQKEKKKRGQQPTGTGPPSQNGPCAEGLQPSPSGQDGPSQNAPSGTGTSQSTPSQAGSQQDRSKQDTSPQNTPSSSSQAMPAKNTPPNASKSAANESAQSASKVAPPSRSSSSAGSHGPMGDLAELIEQGITQYATTTQSYRVWTTEFDRVEIAPNKRQHDHRAMLAGVMPYVGGVRQRLLQSLQAETNCRWFGDQDRGSVDPKSLHRLILDTSPRVFRQRVRSRTKSTAATLLIDLSSSMRGAKLDLAMKTAIVFCEALERLNIPSSVIGFSTAETDLLKRVAEQLNVKEGELVRQYRFVPLRHTILKRFDEPWRKISGRFTNIHSQNLTPLGESLLFAARQTAGRREERRIIICLTDGKPVAGIDPEDVTFKHAKEAIVRIEKAGIEVVPIGIMEPSVERLHEKHVIVRNIQELPGAVIRQLQSILMKGVSHDAARA